MRDRASPRTAEEYVQAIRQALRLGDVLSAEGWLATARQRFPVHSGVLQWDALLADLRWRDEIAVADLKGLCRLADLGGISRAEARGRTGDKLFTMGWWGESAAYLRDGIESTQAPELTARRRAWLALLRQLPSLRQRPGSVELKVAVQSLDGLPQVWLDIGGAVVPFVVDTGATMTTLARSLAVDLGVDPLYDGGEVTDGAGRPFAASYGVLPQLGIGPARLGAQPVLVLDDELMAMRSLFGGPRERVHALLGLDVLLQFRLALDLRGRTLELSLPQGLPADASVPTVRVDGGVRLPVEIDGRSLWFLLDTGASRSTLTVLGLEALPGGSRRAAPTHLVAFTPGGVRVSVRELRDVVVRVGTTVFDQVSLPVVDRPEASTEFPLHGVLGADLIARCRLEFDGGRARLAVR